MCVLILRRTSLHGVQNLLIVLRPALLSIQKSKPAYDRAQFPIAAAELKRNTQPQQSEPHTPLQAADVHPGKRNISTPSD